MLRLRPPRWASVVLGLEARSFSPTHRLQTAQTNKVKRVKSGRGKGVAAGRLLFCFEALAVMGSVFACFFRGTSWSSLMSASALSCHLQTAQTKQNIKGKAQRSGLGAALFSLRVLAVMGSVFAPFLRSTLWSSLMLASFFQRLLRSRQSPCFVLRSVVGATSSGLGHEVVLALEVIVVQTLALRPCCSDTLTK